ncbi:MAG: response regulator transcription factor [Panacagrimonas sp.]
MDSPTPGPVLLDAPVDALIARLYRNGLAVPPERFRTWALEQVAEVIPCDGALWGTGTQPQARFHTVTLLNLPAAFAHQLERTSNINPLFARVLARLDQPVDMESVMPDEAFHASAVYCEAFAPFGIERILSTGHLDARSGLGSLVTLYRKDPGQGFTALEKARQQRVTFHLFNAASHCYFLHLLRNTDRAIGRGAAVVDALGLFHEAQPRFHDLLDEAFPERDRSRSLPFPLPAAGQTVTHGRLCVRCEPLGELLVLTIWKAGPLDRLTAREHEVVMAVSQGLSFKQAARKIGVAPSTVANHLYRVYRKLGVSSRTELATIVHPGG